MNNQHPVNGWAIAGAITSFVALIALYFQLFIICFIGALAGVIMGIVGVRRARGVGGVGWAMVALFLGVIPLAMAGFTLLRILS